MLKPTDAPSSASVSAMVRASRVLVPRRIRAVVAALMGTPSGSFMLDAGTAMSTWIVGDRCSSSTSSSMPFFSRLSAGRRNFTFRISLDTGALFFSSTPLKSDGCCVRGASCAASGVKVNSRMATSVRGIMCLPCAATSCLAPSAPVLLRAECARRRDCRSASTSARRDPRRPRSPRS